MMGPNDRTMAPSSSADTANADADVNAGDCLCISCLRVSSASTSAFTCGTSMSEQYRSRYIKVTGTIVRRRSMGKYLAFAEIQSTSSCVCNNSNSLTHHSMDTTRAEHDPPPASLPTSSSSTSDSGIHVVKVAFRRKSPSWNMAIKNSLLPYGAKVELYVVNIDGDVDAAAVKATDASSVTSSSSNNNNGKDVDPPESAPLSQHQPSPQQTLSSSVFEVHSWTVLVNPSEIALDQATMTTTDGRGNCIRDQGVSCSKYRRYPIVRYLETIRTR
jgi:hypothetical protein